MAKQEPEVIKMPTNITKVKIVESQKKQIHIKRADLKEKYSRISSEARSINKALTKLNDPLNLSDKLRDYIKFSTYEFK
jgi:hypothetical protein